MVATSQQVFCRAQVWIPGHRVDVPLHSHLTVADAVAELIPYLIEHLDAENKDTTWLRDPDAYWHLCTFGNQPLDEDKTLAEEKILDGARLFLTKTDPGEKYVPLIDNVAESITYYLKRHFPSWDAAFSKRISLHMLLAVVAMVCATTVVWTSAHQPGWPVRAALTGAMGLVALVSAAIAVVLVRTDRKERFSVVPVPLMMITYLLAATAALVITPRPLGIYQLVAAASTLLTLAVCQSVLTGKHLRLHYAVIAGSVLVILIGLLNFVYRSPTAVIGVQTIALCLVMVLIASRLALSVAGISLPYVPATGEPFMRGKGAGNLDAGSLPRDGTSSRALESIHNQEQQILTAGACRMGLLIGALAVLVSASVVVGRCLNTHEWLIWSFMLVISVCLVYRGKSLDDAREQAIVVIAAAATLGAFGAGLLTAPQVSSDNTLRGALALGILVVAMVIATILAIQERGIVSPIVAKVLELIDRALYISVFALVFQVMDLYSKARAH